MRIVSLLVGILIAGEIDAGEAQAISPRWLHEVSIAPSGDTTGTPIQGSPYGLFLLRSGRVLIWTSLGLRTYSENGRPLWDYALCPNCSEVSLRDHAVGPVLPAQDGSVWFVKYTRTPGRGFPQPRIDLQRLESDGSHSVSVRLDELPDFLWGYSAYAGDDDAATIFWARDFYSAGRFQWLRVSRSGDTRTGTLTLPTPRFDYAAPVRAYALSNGDSLLVFTPSALPWTCPPIQYCASELAEVLRITPEGQIVWHRSLSLPDVDFELLPHSTAGAVAFATHRAPFGLVIVDEDGNVGPVSRVPGLGTYDSLADVIPLERDDAILVSRNGVQRVDVFGRTLALLSWEPLWPVGMENLISPIGLLIPRHRPTASVDASLLDPMDFATKHEFRVDLPGYTHVRTDHVRAASEGMVWMLQEQYSTTQGDKTVLAAFAIPDTVAEARVYRDGFDP